MSYEEQVQELVAHTVERHGGLHVLVPNAGVGRPQPLLEMSLADWREVTSVNLDGVFLSIRYAAPAIIASGGGTIVTLGAVDLCDNDVRARGAGPGAAGACPRPVLKA